MVKRFGGHVDLSRAGIAYQQQRLTKLAVVVIGNLRAACCELAQEVLE